MTKPRPRLNVPEPRVIAREGHTAYVQIGAGIYTAQAGGVRVYYCRACAWLTSKAARRLRGELGAPRRTIEAAVDILREMRHDT